MFVCGGVLRDFGSRWDRALCEHAADRGWLALRVTYWSDFTGVWFEWGKVAPGRLIAQTADEIASMHAASGCPRPLAIDAVAFSNGCEAVLAAAEATEVATFRRVAFLHSSGSAFSPDAARAVANGCIARLRNWWSPVDVVTALAPLGSGTLPFVTCEGAIENEVDAMPHVPHLIPWVLEERVLAWLDDEAPPALPCDPGYRDAVSRWLTPR